jgi:hypothetical protein
MSKEKVMKKRNFSEADYAEFASEVGRKITWNRRMRMLAEHYETSVFHLSQVVGEQWFEESGALPLMRRYLDALAHSYEDMSIEGIIRLELSKTTEESFRRFGDINRVSPALRRNYLSADGLPLDVQAQCMSSTYEQEIDPCELAEFMMEFDGGRDTYRTENEKEISHLEAEFKHLVGFNLSAEFARQFHKLFFHIPVSEAAKNCPF